ncbi:MAG: helix-turn-helix domain-containing protein [Sphingomonadales bacterium]|nr:helix-turn-helix domain-containing protein [Sphingomonadales bacterium]
MPDPSNPTNRVMDVLNFLAAHPTERFSLAEIARHVGLSNGSAHRLLTTMAARRFLARHERHRTYSLGLALVAIGQAAIEQHRGIDIARRELARLALELGVQCSANALVDGEIVVLAREGTARSQLGLTRVGERRPLLPPVGLCHVAWSGPAAIDTYLAAARPHLDDALFGRLAEAIALVRRRGFAIAAKGLRAALGHDATWLPVDQVRDAAYWNAVFAMIGQLSPGEIQAFDLAEAAAAGVSHISAPVFAPSGSVAFQLVMSGLPSDLTAGQIAGHVERLCATAAQITSETHGRAPD